MDPTLANGMGMKRYGMGLAGAVGMGLTMQPSPGDTETVAMVKLIAQVAPVLLPILMDGCEKIVKGLAEAFAAFKTTKSEAAKIVEQAKDRAVVP